MNYVHKITLPAITKPTVVKFTVSYVVNKGAPKSVDYAVGTDNYIGFNLGDVVTHQTTQTDSAGNVSPASAPQTFTVSDTLPLAAPDAVQFALTKIEA